MIFPTNSFFALLLDIRGPFDMVSHPIFYVPVGISMTLFAVALGVLLLFEGTLSKTIRLVIAGVLIFIAVLLLLWGVVLLFI